MIPNGASWTGWLKSSGALQVGDLQFFIKAAHHPQTGNAHIYNLEKNSKAFSLPEFSTDRSVWSLLVRWYGGQK